MYAVIDLETTGLNPWRHDRIVEIAIVHVDDGGAITSEWCSLVNPQRDLGPQRIHGIRAADARRAPTFSQLAPQITDALRGRVLVAHNVAFDGPFLDHQFTQIGHPTPIRTAANLCTMLLAGVFLPDSGRSLAACCASAGIPLENAHCALDDARAAAQLLGIYLRSGREPAPDWAALRAAAASATWPPLSGGSFAETRRSDPNAVPEHFLSRLVDRLPRVTEPPQADTYLALLDRALIDRRISATESDALVTRATALGLGKQDVVDLHAGYLADLAVAALEDGIVTDDERADLVAVAALLALRPDAVESALDRAASGAPVPRQRTRSRWTLAPGDIVVFTGETPEPRGVWEERARAAGLRVEDAVTTDTRVVVAADIDTMSIKARKAHKAGIPVIDPATFAQMVLSGGQVAR